jgi:hypothetical protein
VVQQLRNMQHAWSTSAGTGPMQTAGAAGALMTMQRRGAAARTGSANKALCAVFR